MDFKFKRAEIASRNIDVYDSRRAPLKLFGLYKPERKGLFERLPSDVAMATNERVGMLYTNTAGARLRFVTDSPFLAVGAICQTTATFPSPVTAAVSGAGASCFDLYVDGEHRRVLSPEKLSQKGSAIGFDLSDGRYEAYIDFEAPRRRSITICFPTAINVSDVYIGVDVGFTVTECEPYRNDAPVVFYGSSITQGFCASRAGNTYPNILSRLLNFDFINLGFAGACKAETPIIEYISTLDMSALVYDYDHNCPNAEFLEKTHLSGLRKIREANRDLPIILMSKPNIHNGREEAETRMRVIEKSYETLRLEGDENVHFVRGLSVFDSLDGEMMTVDGTHPTDFGFYCMAKALIPIFEKIFSKCEKKI